MATDRDLIDVRIAVRKALLSVTIMEWGGTPVNTDEKVDWLTGELMKVISPLQEEIKYLREQTEGLQDHVDALESEMHDPEDCVVLSLVERPNKKPRKASR